MSLLDYFRTKKTSSASLAKERLQILVAHEHAAENQPSYLPELQKELLAVVSKYVEVDLNAITINFEQDEHQDIFELKIDIPSEDD